MHIACMHMYLYLASYEVIVAITMYVIYIER